MEDNMRHLATQLELKQQTKTMAETQRALLEAARSKELRLHNMTSALVQRNSLFVPGASGMSLDHRFAFENSSVAMDIVGLDGRILDCNDQFVALLGRPRDHILNTTIFAITHQDSLHNTFQLISTLAIQPGKNMVFGMCFL
jgi:PAS domain-containing protein